jgi:hypothetical protein
MIYDLDEILKQKLTKDDECKKTYDNLKGLYATGVVEGRHYGEERDIKLNRLERKEEPMKVRKGDFTYLYCPVCGNKFEVWVQLDPYCSKCGQRLQL